MLELYPIKECCMPALFTENFKFVYLIIVEKAYFIDFSFTFQNFALSL